MEFNTSEVNKENYLKTVVISSKLAVNKIKKTVGMFFGWFGILLFLFSFIDYASIRQSIYFNGFSLAISALGFAIYFSAKKCINLLQNANLYVNNFKNDVDGYIKVSDLTFYANQSEETIIKNFKLLQQKGYIINCTLENKRGVNYIVLNNSLLKQSLNNNEKLHEIIINDIIDYNTLKNYKCPNCGASIEIKDINNAICSYCRIKLVFKKVD